MYFTNKIIIVKIVNKRNITNKQTKLNLNKENH